MTKLCKCSWTFLVLELPKGTQAMQRKKERMKERKKVRKKKKERKKERKKKMSFKFFACNSSSFLET